jgi:hypothetical protein
MKLAVVAVLSVLLGGCASLPPFLQRWADIDISTASLSREDSKVSEGLFFHQDGLVRIYHGPDEVTARWRVRGAWLEIDTTNDRTFQTRMRALTFNKDRIVAQSPTGKRSVWRIDRVIVVIKMVPQRPGLWMP